MESSPASHPLLDGVQRPNIAEMEIHPPLTEDPSSSALWDWGELLDFTLDDQFAIPVDSGEILTSLQVNPIETQFPDRVRKRDPRLTCSNFLAGQVPCSCPEIDEKLEEDEVLPGKKRVRITRAGARTARCQVPGCEADISELKGYHRRHRVCIRCANASSVALDGEAKRYCQQCGKFHVLSDFDEGKRSCRRKLERHNNRRRRKAMDSRGADDNETQGGLLTEDATCGDESGKDSLCLSSQMVEKEALVESEDGHVSPPHSAPSSQNLNSDSGVSFGASGETQMNGGKDDLKLSRSPSGCEHKSAYSSMCPTGRISFKLYDWNPAEFPRRLRHQIFEWLANMPVELEGYIRPGCTILTAFIAMPTFMWVKLFEDPMSYLHDLVAVPGKMLSGKGPMFVYLNNMTFHLIKDGTSLVKVNVDRQAPRLHYVHPTCFEAGKAVELIACGSNLLQPKFRFLVSFAGEYLACDYSVPLTRGQTEGSVGVDHQLCKIFIPRIEPNLFGPAFIEVENESGLSNFIPVLIGDTEICSEMEIIQQRFDASHPSNGSHCELSALRQMVFSEFIVDVAWLLKQPSSENFQQIMTSSKIRRFSSILNVLLHHESTTILGKILQNLKVVMDKVELDSVDGIGAADMRLLKKFMDYTNDILCRKLKKSEGVALDLGYALQESISESCNESNVPSIASCTSEDLEKRLDGKSGVTESYVPISRSDEIPLLNREALMCANLIKERPSKSCSRILSNGVLKPRPTMVVIAIVALCFGACAVLLHPHKVSKLAVSIRRCLTDGF